MGEFVRFMFAPHGLPWYAGAIWGNVAASVLTGALVFAYAHLQFKKHKKQRDLNHIEVTNLLASLHNKIDGKDPQ